MLRVEHVELNLQNMYIEKKNKAKIDKLSHIKVVP